VENRTVLDPTWHFMEETSRKAAIFHHSKLTGGTRSPSALLKYLRACRHF
jgi:hypothetical protein